jgi:hypothetical protein
MVLRFLVIVLSLSQEKLSCCSLWIIHRQIIVMCRYDSLAIISLPLSNTSVDFEIVMAL